MTRLSLRHVFVLATCLLSAAASCRAVAQEPLSTLPPPIRKTARDTAPRQPLPLPPSNPAAPPAMTPTDVTAFLDGFLPLQMQRDDIAGATIEITRHGEVLIRKGYGYADWKKKTPVDPVATTFRLASISKTITYTAMMQQVEAGKLDLDTPVSHYLDFPIRPGPGSIGDAPITLRQLATHTAGFEETIKDLGSDRSGRVPRSLRDYLILDQPARYAAPGTKLAYSNYGIAMIGYIVQRVSGEEFAAYATRHVFAPLGMTHSSFIQPLPNGFQRSLGYLDTTKQDTGFESFTPAPAGGLSSTAADMTRFGQMLLAGGTLDGVRILRPESVQLFFTPQFSPAPRVPSWNLGFYSEKRNGYTFTGHGGDLIGFHSEFWVEPTQQLTILVSYNSAKSAEIARTELFMALVDRYLPAKVDKPAYLHLSKEDLAPYEGEYTSARREFAGRLKFLGFVSSRQVEAHDDEADKGTKNKNAYLTNSVAKDLRGAPMRFHPVGGDTFYSEDTQAFFHFTRDAHGRVDGLVSPSRADRVPLGMNSNVIAATGGPAVVALVLTLLAPLVRLWQRTAHRRRPRPQPQRGTLWLRWPQQLAMLGCATVLAIIAAMLTRIGGYDNLWVPAHLDPWLKTLNGVCLLVILLVLLAAADSARTMLRPIRVITRLKFGLVALSGLWFAWFFVYYNLLSTGMRY